MVAAPAGLSLSWHVLALLITIILVSARYDLFPVDFRKLPMSLRDNDDYMRGLAWLKRYEDNSVMRRGQAIEPVQKERSAPTEPLQVSFVVADNPAKLRPISWENKRSYHIVNWPKYMVLLLIVNHITGQR